MEIFEILKEKLQADLDTKTNLIEENFSKKANFNLKFVISDPKNPCMQNFRFVEEQLLLLASFSRFPTTVRSTA